LQFCEDVFEWTILNKFFVWKLIFSFALKGKISGAVLIQI